MNLRVQLYALAALAACSAAFWPAAREKGAKSYTLPLGGGLLHTSGFYTEAKVGGQVMHLQIDTTYSSLIVPKVGCLGCRVGDRRYDPGKSEAAVAVPCKDDRCEEGSCKKGCGGKCGPGARCCTTDDQYCAVDMLYNDGSSGNGTMYEDVLEMGDLKATVLLGAMEKETHTFELPYVDGVIGMAFQKGACHPSCVPPVMDVLANETGIGNVFTMCVSLYGGTLTLGVADRALATKPFQYVDLVDVAAKNRYMLPATGEWKVGERHLSVPGVTKAMLSTGIGSIGMGKSTFMDLLQHFTDHYCHVPGLCSMTSWFRPQSCIPLKDETVALMPNITIGLTRATSVILTPDDYLVRYRVVKGEQIRCVAILTSDSMAAKGIGLLLGSTIMRRYAVVYDRSEMRIGFAPADESKCGPLNGSDIGLMGSIGKTPDANSVLTADSPVAEGTSGIEADTPIGAALLEAEMCRAEKTCNGCAQNSACSFGYEIGRCVPRKDAKMMPYPYCAGVFCACFAVGKSGWYIGILLGVCISCTIIAVAMLVHRKRKRQARYQEVQPFDEQDIETF